MISLIEEHQGVHQPTGLPFIKIVTGGLLSEEWWDSRPDGTPFTAEIMNKMAAMDAVEKRFRRLPPDIRMAANSKVSSIYRDRLQEVPWFMVPAIDKEILDVGLEIAEAE